MASFKVRWQQQSDHFETNIAERIQATLVKVGFCRLKCVLKSFIDITRMGHERKKMVEYRRSTKWLVQQPRDVDRVSVFIELDTFVFVATIHSVCWSCGERGCAIQKMNAVCQLSQCNVLCHVRDKDVDRNPRRQGRERQLISKATLSPLKRPMVGLSASF